MKTHKKLLIVLVLLVCISMQISVFADVYSSVTVGVIGGLPYTVVGVVYTFTPTSAGTFNIYSTLCTSDNEIHIFSDLNLTSEIYSNDDGMNNGLNFGLENIALEAQNYYLKFTTHSTREPGTFTLNIENVVSSPTVTAAHIDINGNTYKVGDTVTAIWNNTFSGDDNTQLISSVTMDFSEFGGGSSIVASEEIEYWTATYTIEEGSIDTTNRNVFVTAYVEASNSTTVEDDTNASVDNISPTVTASNISLSDGTGNNGEYIVGDAVTVTWEEVNADTISNVLIDFSEFGGGTISATQTGNVWAATYNIDAGDIDGGDKNVFVIATDNAGNSIMVEDDTNANVDNIVPYVNASNISLSEGSGDNRTYIVGDAVTATWEEVNADTISNVLIDFSEFGGGTISATQTGNAWTATYNMDLGDIDGGDKNIFVTATDNAGNSITVEDDTNANIDNELPIITIANISLSGSNGNNGEYIIGDTLVASWNNSKFGDDNDDIDKVYVDFSQFGGSASTYAEGTDEYFASININEGTINDTNLNVFFEVTDDAGNVVTIKDESNATVDDIYPTLILTDDNNGLEVNSDSTVVFTALYSEVMTDVPMITITNVGLIDVNMNDTGDGKEWTYTWDVPSNIDSNVMISVVGEDDAGNQCQDIDSVELEIDNTPPEIYGVTSNSEYTNPVKISFSDGTAYLNNIVIPNNHYVNDLGNYIIRVVDSTGNYSSLNFSIIEEKVIISLGGYTKEIAEINREEKRDEIIVKVTVDEEKLKSFLDTKKDGVGLKIDLKEYDSNEKNKSNYIRITAQSVKDLQDKNGFISILTDKGSYSIPALAINLEGIEEGIALSNVYVNIKIASVSLKIEKLLDNPVGKEVYENILYPTSFEIDFTYEGKSVYVEKFNEYVERRIPLPWGVDSSIITTGVKISENGVIYPMPTKIIIVNGRAYAVINSLSNSTYAIINNTVSYSDLEGHWAKDDINDLGSRLIFSDIAETVFEPNKGILRGEYVNILINSLGLMESNVGRDIFNDVLSTNEYYDEITIAYDNNIILGYGESEFKSDEIISREEASIMVKRVLEKIGFDVELDESDISSYLDGYSDSNKISDWARNSMAVCIKYGILEGYDNEIEATKAITRAESGVMIKRLLETADLI